MKTLALSLVAVVGLLARPMVANAVITFDTDTPTLLQGSVSITGTLDQTLTSPSVFEFGADLFGGFCNKLSESRVFDTSFQVGAFFVYCQTEPDFAQIVGSLGSDFTTFDDVGGTIESLAGSGIGPPIYFRFSDFSDTGGETGTFSGDFCFSKTKNFCSRSVPEPGTLALLGLGLLGLGLTSRRRAN